MLFNSSGGASQMVNLSSLVDPSFARKSALELPSPKSMKEANFPLHFKKILDVGYDCSTMVKCIKILRNQVKHSLRIGESTKTSDPTTVSFSDQTVETSPARVTKTTTIHIKDKDITSRGIPRISSRRIRGRNQMRTNNII
ncbi:hypothetical protein A2U01_0015521 [Trifolium medium]|uniref:Uncharacterized protein n=1 Tax=Trifolium medium TaxID=97028 RepID=A0A392N6E2_9FABA|nr:hypothetical protein [Trifolium medium]